MKMDSSMDYISFALPKGRLAEKTIELLTEKGLISRGVVDISSRQLIFEDSINRLKFLLIRNADVITYVQHGVADLGVVGKDHLCEAEGSSSGVYELADLQFGACRMCVASPEGRGAAYTHNIRVATSFPEITKKFFIKKGIFVEIITLYGSVEIAPLTGLSDYIVDLVDTGETLKKNGLEVVETVMESTARLVANKSLARIKHKRLKSLLEKLGI